jgi:hypothetical protein
MLSVPSCYEQDQEFIEILEVEVEVEIERNG